MNEIQEQMVLDNERLIHSIVQGFHIYPNSSDYEDLVSIGRIGLINAVLSYDGKKAKFKTYAITCIRNSVLTDLKKVLKHQNDVSLFTPIDEELCLIDKIEDLIYDSDEEVLTFVKALNVVINYLNTKEKFCMLCLIGGMSQKNIGEILGISQTYVSKIKKDAEIKIRKNLNSHHNNKERFSVSNLDTTYVVSFSVNDIGNLNDFVSFLDNLKSSSNSFNFVINRERISIQIFKNDDSSFINLARILYKLDY